MSEVKYYGNKESLNAFFQKLVLIDPSCSSDLNEHCVLECEDKISQGAYDGINSSILRLFGNGEF